MIIKSVQNNYSFIELFNLIYRLIVTKLKFHNQRLIRSGFICRGSRMIAFGEKLTTGVGCRLEAFIADGNKSTKIYLGNRIQFNDYVHISAIKSVTIGDDVLMASHVYISDNSHGAYKGDANDTSPDIPPIKRPYYVTPVKIGNRVWLGEGVIVMPGVEIGDGAIIGAHSIVNKNIPANTIAVGSPAKVIKRWDDNKKRWKNIGI